MCVLPFHFPNLWPTSDSYHFKPDRTSESSSTQVLGKHCMFIGVDQRLEASCHVQESVRISKWRNIGRGDRKRLRRWSTCYCKGMQYSSQLGDCLSIFIEPKSITSQNLSVSTQKSAGDQNHLLIR